MRVLAIGTNVDKPEAHIFSGLIARGAQIHFIGTPIPEHEELLRKAGASITHYSFAHRLDVKGIRLIKSIVEKERIDIVYALSNRGLSCSVIALFGKRVPIVTYRGTVGHLSRWDPSSWLTYLNPKVERILCVSQAVADYLKSIKISDQKIVTIYKGHDIEWYRCQTPPRESLAIPESAFVVGCTAVMRPVKGVDILLQSVAMLIKELPDLHLLLVGSIKDPTIERLIKQFPDQSRLHLTGYRSDASTLARISDVMVMASINREGFPKSIIEAMSQGVPAIVTAVGGMPELVGHGSAGIMVPPSDPKALAQAIASLYHDRKRAKELGLLGQERIKEVFNVKTTTDKTYQVFKEVTERSLLHSRS